MKLETKAKGSTLLSLYCWVGTVIGSTFLPSIIVIVDRRLDGFLNYNLGSSISVGRNSNALLGTGQRGLRCQCDGGDNKEVL